MSQAEREKWNRTYREGTTKPHFEGDEAVVVAWAREDLAAESSILDLGCGRLRNSLALAESGHNVLAIDVAEEAFNTAPEPPASMECQIFDLDEWDPPESAFDLIIAVHYLNRPLYPSLPKSLRPGGRIALETRLAEEMIGDSPPPFRLLADEIPDLFPTLTVARTEIDRSGEIPVIRALFISE